MPLKDPEARREYINGWIDRNRDKVNARARAQWKHRHSTPEKHEHYLKVKQEWYDRTKDTRNEYKRAYRAANRARLIKERIQTKVGKYGITTSQYHELFNACGGRCLSCGDEFAEASTACVDHCHQTGVIRGLLCPDCNRAEGFLRTSEKARKLYEYILKNEISKQGSN